MFASLLSLCGMLKWDHVNESSTIKVHFNDWRVSIQQFVFCVICIPVSIPWLLQSAGVSLYISYQWTVLLLWSYPGPSSVFTFENHTALRVR